MSLALLNNTGLYPTLEVLADFTDATVAPPKTPTWTDITDKVREMSVKPTYRQNALDRFEAGTLTMTLSNADRDFDPTYTSSPYYPFVRPMTRFKVRATWDSVVYELITAFMDGAPQEWPSFGTDALVKVACTDLFKVLNLADLDQSGAVALKGKYTPGTGFGSIAAGDTGFWLESWPREWPDPASVSAHNFLVVIDSEWMLVTGAESVLNTSTGLPSQDPAERSDSPVFVPVTRAQNGTTAAAHTAGAGVQRAGLVAKPTGDRILDVLKQLQLEACVGTITYGGPVVSTLDTGISSVVKMSPGSELKGVMALGHILDVVDTENGVVFVRGDGDSGEIVFQDRHHRITDELTSKATFGDRAFNLLHDLDPSFEAGTAGWDPYGGATRTRVSSVGQAFADGDWIGQFTTSGAHQGIVAVDHVDVEPSEVYTLSSYCNLNVGQTIRLWIDWFDGSSAFVGSSISSNFAGTGAMERYSFSPTSSQDAATALVYILTEDATPQTIDVEAIQLERGRHATTFTPYGELGYEDITAPYDEERLWNVARVTCADASSTVETWQNDASVTRNGPRALDRTSLSADLNDGQNAAQYLAYKYGDPELRFDQIVVQPASDPASAWPAILSLRISDLVTVIRRPDVGPAISLDNYVEAMPQHDITPDGWKVTLSLSDAEKDTFWLMGDATYGVLGSTTKPGY